MQPDGEIKFRGPRSHRLHTTRMGNVVLKRDELRRKQKRGVGVGTPDRRWNFLLN